MFNMDQRVCPSLGDAQEEKIRRAPILALVYVYVCVPTYLIGQ